jgi:streptogramin lyase
VRLSLALESRFPATETFAGRDLGHDIFDAAFSRFGVMFFSNPVAAFGNIRASLKAGGRLAFVCCPYRAEIDKNGELWTGGMSSDRVVRLDPKSGKAVEYLMPSATNMRTVYVDNSTTPVTFWVGSNHAHALVKVEPLD